MGSEIAQLRERLLLEWQAIYLGLHGYGEVTKHEVIRQRNRQMSQTIQQLDSHIGEEATDVMLSEAMELAAQAYQKEQQPKTAGIVACDDQSIRKGDGFPKGGTMSRSE